MTRKLSENVAIGLLLVLGVIGILFWFFSSYFNGLSSADALDQAQIARHISLGHGYRTSVIRPLDLALAHNVDEKSLRALKQTSSPAGRHTGSAPMLRTHSDRFYAPLHPLVTAIGFVFLGRSDKSAAVSSALFYVLTMAALFLLAKGIFDWRVGIISVIIFATSEVALRYAISGLEVSLATFLFTLLLYAIYASISQDDDYDSQPKRLTTRMVICGVIFGLCCLARYAMVVFILPLLLLLFAHEQARIKRVAAFLVGLILIVAPWLGRNYVVAGNPFFTLQGYQLLTLTSDYPGTTVYRKVEQPESASPLWFLLTHPVQVAKKALKNLRTIYSHLLGIINPVIIGFFIVSIFYRFESPEIEQLRFCFYAMFILLIPVAALTTVTSSTFVIFIPVLIIFAIGCFMRHVDRIQFREKFFGIRSKFIVFTSGHARGAVVCALVAVCAFPLFWDLAIGEGKGDNPLPRLRELKSILPPDALVVSDVPWAVAWHAERTSFWLPEIKTGQSKGTENKGMLDAIYLSPTVLNYGEAEKVEGYKKMFLGQSRPRGFEEGKLLPGLGMLFVKKRAGGEKP